MDDFFIFKVTHDLHDRIDLSDRRKKFISKPFSRTRSFYQSRNINKLNRRMNTLRRS
jgi:hypothetical protein